MPPCATAACSTACSISSRTPARSTCSQQATASDPPRGSGHRDDARTGDDVPGDRRSTRATLSSSVGRDRLAPPRAERCHLRRSVARSRSRPPSRCTPPGSGADPPCSAAVRSGRNGRSRGRHPVGVRDVRVGTLRALAEPGISPALVVGTSVGPLNGAVLTEAGDVDRAADRLREVWSGLRREDVFRGTCHGPWARKRSPLDLDTSHALNEPA